LLGEDPQLDLALLDVEDGICGISLGEDDLPLAQLDPGFSGPDPRQEGLGIERRWLSFDFHANWPSARHSGLAGQPSSVSPLIEESQRPLRTHQTNASSAVAARI